jgi:hypothetical protein
MKLFCFPYRWRLRTIWTNITHPYYDLKNGILNLITFFEAVWWFHSWDEDGMLHLLEISAREMRKQQELGIHVGDEKQARRLLIVETLCKRLRADRYFENAGYDNKRWKEVPDFERSRIAKHAGYMPTQDARYLGQMLRFVQHWWS